MVAALGELRVDRAGALFEHRRELMAAMGSELFVYYAVDATDSGIAVRTIGGASLDPFYERMGRKVFEYPARFGGAWPAYNPMQVSAPLRNRVSVLSRASDEWAAHDEVAAKTFSELRVDGMDQLRALVCDGPSLLYWVGFMRKERYSEREVRAFRRLLPLLERRLRVERSLAGAPSLSLISRVLHGFGTAAFLLGPRGRIEACNELGLRAWERDRGSLRAELGSGSFEVTRLSDGYSLAVARSAPQGSSERSGLAARRWGLTPRQSDVLRELSSGRTNWQIASALGCTERTVEVHVSAILARTGLENRASLIAEVLSRE
ncbi:MAG: response regulator transcription factor [Myxococcaceae bacterium]